MNTMPTVPTVPTPNPSTVTPTSRRGGPRIGRVLGGLFFGLLLGAGLAMMSVLYAVAAAGTKAPWVVLGVMTLLGLLVGLVPRRRTG
jgi:predicted lipid-binding transport protein (Tim44 family)